MNSTISKRSAGLAALALTMSLGLSACGSDDDTTAPDAAAAEASETPVEEAPAETEPTEEEAAEADPSADVFGPACDQIPADGAGSFNGMATEPVATAAAGNPLLSTLVTAVKKADLVDTLNGAEDVTVFAPYNDAFGAFSKKELNGLLKDKKTLTTVLSHHVVPGKMGPDMLAGEFETLAGDMLKIEGSGEEFSVGNEKATILCGNIPTANATVYVIDTVLMPG